MRTKTLCTSCEQYVYTDADHSCRDAKALRAVRDAEAAVVAAAERFMGIYNDNKDANAVVWALGELEAFITALHAARQGGA